MVFTHRFVRCDLAVLAAMLLCRVTGGPKPPLLGEAGVPCGIGGEKNELDPIGNT